MINISNGLLDHDREIHTSFNSSGHRCDEIVDVLGKDLNFRKYFLVLGDNAGMHMHQSIEETWPYLLAQELNYKYYNLCVIDGGLEAVRFNLLSWLNKYIPPKYIFISCEWANRFFEVNYEDDMHDINKASSLGDTAGYFLGRQRLFSILIEHIDIPIYQIMRETDIPVIVSSKVTNIVVDHTDDQAVVDIVSKGFTETKRAISV